ncbi:hypothetical protein ACWX0K_04345 [Nitrobacteraceae bacterium UC4446_H13]
MAVVVLALSGFTLALCDESWSQAPAAGPQGGSQNNFQAVDIAPSAAAPAAVPLAAPAAPRTENPGLINEIGKLLERRQPLFPALTLPSLELSPAAADRAGSDRESAPNGKPESNGLPRLDLKIPSMQTGREKCPVAANGASDCKAAADALCRAHGYKEGKGTDTDATQKCSAEALLLSGRKSQPGACRTDYFVTRAWCQ